MTNSGPSPKDRKAVAEVNGPRNNVSLKEYYDTGGLGVEALFLRYIYGALKKGGRAFVIVPLPVFRTWVMAPAALVKTVPAPRFVWSVVFPELGVPLV